MTPPIWLDDHDIVSADAVAVGYLVAGFTGEYRAAHEGEKEERAVMER